MHDAIRGVGPVLGVCFCTTPPIPTHSFSYLRDSRILSFLVHGIHKPTWLLCSGSSEESTVKVKKG